MKVKAEMKNFQTDVRVIENKVLIADEVFDKLIELEDWS